MSIRAFFAMLLAVAVFFAPTLARAGEAFAAVPDHHAQMMKSGHCKNMSSDEDTPADKDKAAAKSCCTSMCMAIAIVPTPPLLAERFHQAASSPGVSSFNMISPAELATPPPKFS